jgi:hypothetical protein
VDVKSAAKWEPRYISMMVRDKKRAAKEKNRALYPPDILHRAARAACGNSTDRQGKGQS